MLVEVCEDAVVVEEGDEEGDEEDSLVVPGEEEVLEEEALVEGAVHQGQTEAEALVKGHLVRHPETRLLLYNHQQHQYHQYHQYHQQHQYLHRVL